MITNAIAALVWLTCPNPLPQVQSSNQTSENAATAVKRAPQTFALLDGEER